MHAILPRLNGTGRRLLALCVRRNREKRAPSAFSQWIRDDETRSLAAIVSDVLDELLILTGAPTLSSNPSDAGRAC